MPYEPIHHKYRPQTFKDLVGQETIALTLSNALKQEKIAPAYLLTGPRGTGKTSSARILAKSLNCLNSNKPTPEPCGECEACLTIARGSALDVMEIDAASNTGVDNIREIIERSRFAPVQCRYKIYAIDECHMLSTAAFNALLKTLEEPPPQVVFILATTDPQRVLSTIISRCQRFDYRRIPLLEMVGHLKYIANEEQIAIADDALTLIAQIANGGLRDAESLLDQLSLLPDTISVEKVWDLVGAVPERDLLKLLHEINKNNSLEVIEQCRNLLDRGREPIVVLQNLASFYLNLLIAKTAPQRPDMVAVTETCWQQLCQEATYWNTGLILRGQQHLKEAEIQLKKTTQPRLWLEITLLGLLPQAYQSVVSTPANSATDVASNVAATKEKLPQNNISPTNTPPATKTAEKISQPSPKLPEAKSNSVPPLVSPTQPTSIKPIDNSVVEETVTSPPVNTSQIDLEEIWRKVLSCLQPPTTQALLKQQCHLISFDGSSAIVGISSATLQKLNQGKVPNIEQAFARVVQHKVKVQLEVASRHNNSAKKNSEVANNSIKSPVPEQESSVNSANNINNYEANLTAESNGVDGRLGQLQSTKPFLPQTATKEADSSLETIVVESKKATASSITPLERSPSRKNNAIISPSVEPSTPIQNVDSTISQTSSELDIESDYEEDDLGRAIANLTQSFEGELVQMDEDRDFTSETLETVDSESSLLMEGNSRPSLEDYDDDW